MNQMPTSEHIVPQNYQDAKEVSTGIRYRNSHTAKKQNH